MQYRRMGNSGLRLSALSLGAWVTFGGRVGRGEARELVAQAYAAGINFFDNAEVYARGEAERVMGDVIADLRLPRDGFCVSSKVLWGSVEDPRPTQQGLSRKHVTEACHQALKRLRVEYLDLYLCHRPDPETPIEETVLAMDSLIRQGKVLYWGTSEWPAELIRQAHKIARAAHLHAPSLEQPQYNLLHRERLELEYAPLCAELGMGTTVWSPLASGVLSGKYLDGIPAESRFTAPGYEWLARKLDEDSERRPRQLREFVALAAELSATPAQLAIAWCLANPQVSTVLLGASRREQLAENLGALDVHARLDDSTVARIESVFAR
ncbi:aldo/keto reductase [Aquimonas sp.]|jgi:voltage-dependent potassium channel beta subunit|uniref:aldo/keto reductase n=1 Tax=Aquimonas sp. TaxID=1872588 RepID=UPI0037BFA9F8